MSTGVIVILIVLAVAFLVAGVALAKPLSGSGRGLRRRFGPEYARTVAQHDGDTEAAEKELRERARRHRRLEVHSLTAEAQARYADEWTRVQEQFVHDPVQAVSEADLLLGRVARDCGFPADEADEQLAALSVYYPYRVDSYRQLHQAARRSGEVQTASDELREVLVRAHGLFDELIGRKS